jgi:hypothetical protein
MKRAAAAALLAGLLAGAAAGQSEPEPEYFAPSAGSGRWDLRWDALVRYDAIELSKQDPGAPNIFRWRTELRPEVDWVRSDRFRAGARLLASLSSDANRTNLARLDNYRSNTIELDRLFVEAKPGDFTLLGGKFEMPFRTTEMLWDRDLQPAGAAAFWRAPISMNSSLSVGSGFFYGPQRHGDASRVFASQATLELGTAGPVSVEWSEAYWQFGHLDRTARSFQRQNSGSSYGPGYPPGYGPGYGPGPTAYAGSFRILDSLVRVRAPWGRLPLLLSVDYIHNFGATEADYADGLEISLRAGRVGVPGDLEVFEIYQMVDRDAVVGAYNTDDWWFHTWYVGHRVGVSVTVLPQVLVRPSVVFQRRQDREHYLNRYLIDVVKMF